ncbi:uncharacterized protein LY89DRAFT_255139 [Mollisia scopiformis]|uniref:Uncharacterized protein n=1 Tax=Mollisia scopiformis TaxID=149040 RepID=A0A132BE25_MOLSC|nr:uncharacterized protein LY89DRAFT_255139 [Mollisia scopiformis]KUJ10249.1 hypothetical protein LY89DRAFT_255139 [Mollisia scopiformis]
MRVECVFLRLVSLIVHSLTYSLPLTICFTTLLLLCHHCFCSRGDPDSGCICSLPFFLLSFRHKKALFLSPYRDGILHISRPRPMLCILPTIHSLHEVLLYDLSFSTRDSIAHHLLRIYY